MKNFLFSLLALTCVLTSVSSRAIDLKQSKFTQIVNEVQVISAADKSAKPAAVDGIFKVPDILRTGPNSRAELVAEDRTITRVGANTVFSFDPANRTIDLEKGSLLFHSPKGRGGGTIRTGSATASVLGTTIVVTTTAKGGFKVLVLEGEAEVKFLNGVAQHLSAGQMTFVLPGGGMSPIIVFRLEDNTRNSKMVNGFDHPLPSSQKINSEINKQNKLIQKGRATDTGLLVGNDANSSQVQAIDPSVLQDYFNRLTSFKPKLVGNGYLTVDGFFVQPDSEEEPVTDALFPALSLSVDATIKSPTLDPHRTFISTGPFRVTVPGLVDFNNFLVNPFAGFFARNLTINTRHIDMSAFSDLDFFDFMAAKNLKIGGSVTFDGLVKYLYLTAGGQIVIAPGSTVAATTYSLYLGSFGPMHFNNVNFVSTPGDVNLNTLSDMVLNSGSVSGAFNVNLRGHGIAINGTTISATEEAVSIYSDFAGTDLLPSLLLNHATVSGPGGLQLRGNGDVQIKDSAISSLSAHSYVDVNSDNGSILVNGGTFTARNSGIGIAAASLESVNFNAAKTVNISGATMNASLVVLNAGDGILLDNVTMNSSALRATAINDVRIGSSAHNMDLSSLSDVNISGHTLAFQNVNFGGSPVLKSDVGQLAANPNTSQAVQRGYVNFIQGVTYNGTLITSANQSTYVNPNSGQGIFIYQR